MDELKEKIKKTTQNVDKIKNDILKKSSNYFKEIDKELEKSFLPEKAIEDIEKVRKFIRKNQK